MGGGLSLYDNDEMLPSSIGHRCVYVSKMIGGDSKLMPQARPGIDGEICFDGPLIEYIVSDMER